MLGCNPQRMTSLVCRIGRLVQGRYYYIQPEWFILIVLHICVMFTRPTAPFHTLVFLSFWASSNVSRKMISRVAVSSIPSHTANYGCHMLYAILSGLFFILQTVCIWPKLGCRSRQTPVRTWPLPGQVRDTSLWPGVYLTQRPGW